MSTVADLIQGALRALGVLASGEPVGATEQTDAFNALNDMLDGWANERLTLYATLRSTYTLTPNHNPHTLGTEGSPDFNATRPVHVDRASIVLASSANTELPLNLASDHDWQLVQGKVTQGTPYMLWVETAFPLVKLWLNPVPVNADTLVLYTWQQLGRFAATNTTVDLPPGYARALRLNLALELAPEYGAQPSQTLLNNAMEAKAELKRANTKPLYLRSDGAVLRRGPFNVVSGDRG